MSIKILAILLDTILIMTGARPTPDPELVKVYGAKTFITIAAYAIIIYSAYSLIGNGWESAKEVVALRKENHRLKIKIEGLFNDKEYLKNIIKRRSNGVQKKDETSICEKKKQDAEEISVIKKKSP